ncbi:uncharacterized protein LOC129720840 [Wyeomyia smithii]|uniref:uncharacterized protein LOC129720840 n=1 Tax=Wyeomyia smithii TaxID=174621 RepID=UPI002467BF5A|nr:uncharacterized protein LOC129720840 [Wyeomyia smithii]
MSNPKEEAFLIAPEVDENLPPEERLKLDKTFEKEITRLQRKYLNIANAGPAAKDVQIMRCLEKKLKHLKRERCEQRTELKVAYAPCHVTRYERQLQHVEENVRKYEQLDLEIAEIRTEILHLQSQMKRLEKERKDLQKISQSDHFYYNRVLKAKKRLATLKDKLYHMKKRESIILVKNRKLKEMVEDMLIARRLFHQQWRRMIDQLAYDKKFLIDMIERTILAFNQGEELCRKIDSLKEYAAREQKAQRQEMLELQRRIKNDQKNHEFLRSKGFLREMCELDPREVYRRNTAKRDYSRKIELYTRIIEKTKKFCKVQDVTELIGKYQIQEDAFFAHFNYLNELNFQFERLNCTLKELHEKVDDLKDQKQANENRQEKSYKQLHEQLLKECQTTKKLEKFTQDDESELLDQFKELDEILEIIGYDRAEVSKLLGDHRKATKQNVKRFLITLEKRLNTVLAEVYTSPVTCEDPSLRRPITHAPEEIVRIEQVLTTQQCAECAEGQDVNKYDEGIVLPKDKQQIRVAMIKKSRAPEMEYRMHNLSKCKLPRSRILVNKRYQ